MKVKVISLPYIFQVLYVLCFTRPRYQVSVYRTIGPLVVVSRLHYIYTLKQELNGTKAYKETSTDEKTVVNSHSNDLPYVKESQDKLL